jgi:dTDP-4-dehydrorhamnose 3,5-epimerase
MMLKMFELIPLILPGAFRIQGQPRLDDRGHFHKVVHRDFFEQHGLEWSFSEQFYTTSRKDVLRGMHFQVPPHDHVKLIYCSHGSALDVLLDLREGSPTFGKCTDANLKGGDGQSIYIPKGIAHGFLSLEDNTTVHYAVTSVHQPSSDKGILWSSIPYQWPASSPLLSERDRALPSLKEFRSPFKVKK